MKVKLLNILALIILVLAACDEGNQIKDNVNYSWVESSKSPKGSFIIDYFKIGSDGNLYSMGFNGTQKVFSQYQNNTWQTIAEVDEWVIIDFTIFKGAVYYSTYTTLKKVSGNTVEEILDIDFCGLEVYQNVLIITGSPIKFKENEYTIMSFDGENTFTPIDHDIQSHTMKIVNNKLFIGGHPLKIFNGVDLIETSYYGGYLNIDNNESIYASASKDEKTVIRKFTNDNFEDLGNSITTSAIIERLEFNNETIVIAGALFNEFISESFFLNGENQWKKITTQVRIIDMINFEGKILASTGDGQILELVSDSI